MTKGFDVIWSALQGLPAVPSKNEVYLHASTPNRSQISSTFSSKSIGEEQYIEYKNLPNEFQGIDRNNFYVDGDWQMSGGEISIDGLEMRFEIMQDRPYLISDTPTVFFIQDKADIDEVDRLYDMMYDIEWGSRPPETIGFYSEWCDARNELANHGNIVDFATSARELVKESKTSRRARILHIMNSATLASRIFGHDTKFKISKRSIFREYNEKCASDYEFSTLPVFFESDQGTCLVDYAVLRAGLVDGDIIEDVCPDILSPALPDASACSILDTLGIRYPALMYKGELESSYKGRGAYLYDRISKGNTLEKEILSSFSAEQKSVLELGCGSGNTTSFLAQKGSEIVGLDNSQDLLRLADQRSNSWEGTVTFEFGDIANWKSTKSYNLVCMPTTTIRLFKENQRIAVFKNVLDCLSPDGKFLISVPERQESGLAEVEALVGLCCISRSDSTGADSSRKSNLYEYDIFGSCLGTYGDTLYNVDAKVLSSELKVSGFRLLRQYNIEDGAVLIVAEKEKS